jgi:hypothetical protein
MLTSCPYCGAVVNPTWRACPVCGASIRTEAMPTVEAGSPQPQCSPCVACGKQDRWDDAGIWRCKHCWPEPLTLKARQARPGDALIRTRPGHFAWATAHTEEG